MTDRFRVVPAAYVLLRHGDRVLLQRRANTGYMDGRWAVGAAGHVEAGESVLDAAVRETAEELGVIITLSSLEPLCVMHRTGADGRPIDERVDFFFVVRDWVGEPDMREPGKSAGLRWFDLDALPDDVVPHERRVLDGLRDGTLAAVVPFGFDPDEAAEQAAAAGI